MRFWMLGLIVLLGTSVGISNGRGGDKTAKPLALSYHGQSFFILTTSKGTNIAFDPHLIPDYGRTAGLKADIVLISHNHNDHTRIDALENYQDKNVKVIRGLRTMTLKSDWSPIDETVGEVKIKSIGTYHDDSEGLLRGKNTIFIVEVDGWRIVHLGDLGHLLTPAQVKRIGIVDVLMIPVGGIYTLNGSEANKVVQQLKPREYIFPMHYGTKVFDATLPPDEFYEGQEKRKVAISDDNTMRLNKDPQRPRPLTVQLNFWPKEEKKN